MIPYETAKINQKDSSASSSTSCSLRLAHAITSYQCAVKAMRLAEDTLAQAASPFIAHHNEDEQDLIKLSFVLPNSKVARRVYERIYQLQDIAENA